MRPTDNARRLAAADQAANWLIALQTGEMSRQQRAEFIDWLRESSLHVSEMLHVCHLHRDLVVFSRWPEIGPTRPQADSNVVMLPGPDVLPSRHSASRSVRKHVALLALAACLGICCLIAQFALNRLAEPLWKTEPGERREVTLSDGSVIDLAPSSEVSAVFRKDLRSIALKRGEALFQVAKDPSRPFVVQIKDTRVRAVGTLFNVAQDAQGISVTVVEGRVTVSKTATGAAGEPPDQAIPLSANEQMYISVKDRSSKVRKVRGNLEVAWAAGQLIFENERVAEVVRRFNLYNKLQLRLADERLGERRVGGMFRSTDPESFAAFLQAAEGVAVDHSTANVITIGTAGIDK